MKLSEILAITGLPGLYKVVNERKGGLIVESLADGKRRFAPQRKHQFAPLESMAMYTDDGEAEPLNKLFTRMNEQAEDNPAPAVSAPKDVLFEYVADVLPNYDKERVHPSDIKRLLKWYHFMKENDLFGGDEEE
ncbi:DUF5606 domain-containing protein [Neolewinella lacunae]|uniref:DUF5606 domain-containing protein n=1 Tax=Neolewinella lacunae TaxID=1517758 RepID=A0A923TA48_9BACT|nr:DUF5606 domain-containing protein [Neolewinella lacunae]MBC6995773.1 DUF5606 domain-containing protein [Neolewinella lacunae]MDN3636534.1 DUF5606 domain-containing protein [Neolewinella lacunae]